MPKAKVVTDAERAYLERRLAPVLAALRADEALREEFLLFVQQRGGGISLTLERLKTVWWPSRKSMYPGFFVLAVVEFGLAHGLFPREKAVASRSRRTDR
jgi:ABC-type phosphate transport system auxiliary subunit